MKPKDKCQHSVWVFQRNKTKKNKRENETKKIHKKWTEKRNEDCAKKNETATTNTASRNRKRSAVYLKHDAGCSACILIGGSRHGNSRCLVSKVFIAWQIRCLSPHGSGVHMTALVPIGGGNTVPPSFFSGFISTLTATILCSLNS